MLVNINKTWFNSIKTIMHIRHRLRIFIKININKFWETPTNKITQAK